MLKTIYINIDFGKEVNDNDPKFKVGDYVRISKYKSIFAKGYTPNWSEEIFAIVVKKTEYNKLDTKVDNINTTNFVKKTKYEKDVSDFEDKIIKVDKKIPDISNLVKKLDFSSKVTEIEGKIPSINGLATNSELTAIENKIPDASSLVKKTNFNTKGIETEDKIPNVSSLVKKRYATETANLKTGCVTNAALNARHKDLTTD